MSTETLLLRQIYPIECTKNVNPENAIAALKKQETDA
jgi:hypothetical protein